MEIAVELLEAHPEDADIVLTFPTHSAALEALGHHELAAAFHQPAADGKALGLVGVLVHAREVVLEVVDLSDR
jgi:hypothetical protein